MFGLKIKYSLVVVVIVDCSHFWYTLIATKAVMLVSVIVM